MTEQEEKELLLEKISLLESKIKILEVDMPEITAKEYFLLIEEQKEQNKILKDKLDLLEREQEVILRVISRNKEREIARNFKKESLVLGNETVFGSENKNPFGYVEHLGINVKPFIGKTTNIKSSNQENKIKSYFIFILKWCFRSNFGLIVSAFIFVLIGLGILVGIPKILNYFVYDNNEEYQQEEQYNHSINRYSEEDYQIPTNIIPNLSRISREINEYPKIEQVIVSILHYVEHYPEDENYSRYTSLNIIPTAEDFAILARIIDNEAGSRSSQTERMCVASVVVTRCSARGYMGEARPIRRCIASQISQWSPVFLSSDYKMLHETSYPTAVSVLLNFPERCENYTHYFSPISMARANSEYVEREECINRMAPDDRRHSFRDPQNDRFYLCDNRQGFLYYYSDRGGIRYFPGLGERVIPGFANDPERMRCHWDGGRGIDPNRFVFCYGV